MTVVNEKQFKLSLQLASKEVPGMHLLFQKRVALDGLRRVVFKTPVDTGRARGSIQAAGTTNENLTGRLDPGGSNSIAQGSANLNAIRRPYGIMFVFSNLAYIVPLEDGHSGQAPQGMFAVTRRELTRGETAAAGIKFTVRR